MSEEVDTIQKEFQTLMQTNEMVNELWKKFNDLILYCPEYHGNEKLKVERFKIMLCDDICEVISPFKCTTHDALLSRAHVRDAELLRKKRKETKEAKRKLKLGDRDAKKPNKKIEMVNARHKEVMKPLTSKGAESLINDANHEDNENGLLLAPRTSTLGGSWMKIQNS
nr:zinc finger, CCHC-type, retrotransposon Gag domain protein [Tanacetum cinerariifolium]